MAIAAATARTRARSAPCSERTVSSEASPSFEVSTGSPAASWFTSSAFHLGREVLGAQLDAPLLEVFDRARVQREPDVVDVPRDGLPRRGAPRHQELHVR